jgi:hypothetical protein
VGAVARPNAQTDELIKVVFTGAAQELCKLTLLVVRQRPVHTGSMPSHLARSRFFYDPALHRNALGFCKHRLRPYLGFAAVRGRIFPSELTHYPVLWAS